MVFKVAIIGAGNLGSRHLQALKLTQKNISITVCEPSQRARELALERYNEYPENEHICDIQFLSDYKEMSLKQDLIIVATNAFERYDVAKWIVEKVSVKNIILEKVVFQEERYFDDFSKILEKKSIKVWVNCPRRMFTFYKDMKDIMYGAKYVDMIVSGSSWGMGCNSIHMLDLYGFLTSCTQYEYDNTRLDKGFFESKRNTYIEFSGELLIKTDKGNLIIKNYKEGEVPCETIIDSDKCRAVIKEAKKLAIIENVDNAWKEEQVEIDIKYQSALTNIVVEQIIETGDCELTKFEETIAYHKVLLSCFLNHLNKASEVEVKRCPIT